MEMRKLTCITCPMGCTIDVEMVGTEIISVKGNRCPRGESYARKEVTDPRRIVTSTVDVFNGVEPRVPVKTREDIPKNKVMECVKCLKGITAKAPIEIGDVIVENVADTGIDIVATKRVKSR